MLSREEIRKNQEKIALVGFVLIAMAFLSFLLVNIFDRIKNELNTRKRRNQKMDLLKAQKPIYSYVTLPKNETNISKVIPEKKTVISSSAAILASTAPANTSPRSKKKKKQAASPGSAIKTATKDENSTSPTSSTRQEYDVLTTLEESEILAIIKETKKNIAAIGKKTQSSSSSSLLNANVEETKELEPAEKNSPQISSYSPRIWTSISVKQEFALSRLQ